MNNIGLLSYNKNQYSDKENGIKKQTSFKGELCYCNEAINYAQEHMYGQLSSTKLINRLKRAFNFITNLTIAPFTGQSLASVKNKCYPQVQNANNMAQRVKDAFALNTKGADFEVHIIPSKQKTGFDPRFEIRINDKRTTNNKPLTEINSSGCITQLVGDSYGVSKFFPIKPEHAMGKAKNIQYMAYQIASACNNTPLAGKICSSFNSTASSVH